MNTKMTTRARIPKLLLLMAAAVVVALSMGLTAAPSYAADENYTLNVNYAPWNGLDPTELRDAPPTELTLYRVGNCAKSGGSWDITLVDALSNVTLTKDEIAAMNSKPENERIEAWLGKAATISEIIMNNPDLQESLKAKTTSTNPQSFAGNGAATFNGLDQGIYLIQGSGQWVETTDKYWTPQPMLVQVIAAQTQANLKPISQEGVDEITLRKAWEGDTDEDGEVKETRPTSIEVVISYDGEPVETVTLTAEKNWTYKFKTTSGKRDPNKWSAAEKTLLTNYTPEISRSNVVNGEMTITMTNIYEEKERELELIKILPYFVDHGKKVSTAFAFEITGYQGSNKAYHRYAGLSFDKAGRKSETITGIPMGLDRLVVREVDSAGYNVKDGAEKEAKLEGDTYTVTFENVFDEIIYEGGVINKYKQTGGKYRFDFREGIVRK